MTTQTTREIVASRDSIAFCGLYCGACRSYVKGKCPGCKENEKASWCKVRQCCMKNNFASCADCTIKPLDECKEFNNFMAKMFGIIFNSDRKACVHRIKEIGYDAFAREMTEKKTQTIRRK